MPQDDRYCIRYKSANTSCTVVRQCAEARWGRPVQGIPGGLESRVDGVGVDRSTRSRWCGWIWRWELSWGSWWNIERHGMWIRPPDSATDNGGKTVSVVSEGSNYSHWWPWKKVLKPPTVGSSLGCKWIRLFHQCTLFSSWKNQYAVVHLVGTNICTRL